MNVRHAAALALVGRYLMIPSWTKIDAHTQYLVGPEFPYHWIVVQSFDSAAECHAARVKMSDDAKAEADSLLKTWLSKQGRQAYASPEKTFKEFYTQNRNNLDNVIYPREGPQCAATDDPRLAKKP
jgi:hypothetical protein